MHFNYPWLHFATAAA